MKCRIIVELPDGKEHLTAMNNIQDQRLKEKILSFIDKLIGDGYNHFVVFINSVLDYKLLELLYFYQKRERRIVYTVGMWVSEENTYEWLDDEPFLTDILAGASRVHYRSSSWYDDRYTLKKLIVKLI